MSHLSRRLSASVLTVSAAFALAHPAAAAPLHPRLIGPRAPLAAPRTAHPFVMHDMAAPLRFAQHPAPVAPLKALPLIAPPAPVRRLSGLLPRLELGALPAIVGTDSCAAPRTGVVLSSLPATPYAPLACERDLSASDGRALPSSLVPGHNKQALYGRGYSPQFHDAP